MGRFRLAQYLLSKPALQAQHFHTCTPLLHSWLRNRLSECLPRQKQSCSWKSTKTVLNESLVPPSQEYLLKRPHDEDMDAMSRAARTTVPDRGAQGRQGSYWLTHDLPANRGKRRSYLTSRSDQKLTSHLTLLIEGGSFKAIPLLQLFHFPFKGIIILGKVTQQRSLE